MQWEHLTATDFRKAVRSTGVCILATGVMEKHSEHLPLGTDFLNGHRIACLAAEKEPAVVFPPFYFGQIYEASCFPGTITVKPSLLLELFQEVFDAIGRNGFKKIIISNAHGGNNHLLPLLAQYSLWGRKPYSLYLPPLQHLNATRKKVWNGTLETKEHGHACECETSISLANHAHLVKMERVPKAPATARKRMSPLDPTFTGVRWYSDYPDHYAGDARSATAQKGKVLLGLLVDSLAEYIAAVKADRVVPALEAEFFRRAEELEGRCPPPPAPRKRRR